MIATKQCLVPVGPVAKAAVEKARLHRSGSPEQSFASSRQAWSCLRTFILARLLLVPCRDRKQQTLPGTPCPRTGHRHVSGSRGGSGSEDLR
jgi:hypothetical protein